MTEDEMAGWQHQLDGNRPATPLFSPACWELGFQAWAQSTCPELAAQEQTKEAITEGIALEATGNRLKPCGY